MSPVPRMDVPAPAHAKAMGALDEFDALTVEYVLLLEIQRGMVHDGNVDGLTETTARGDGLARSAARCGRRVSALREAVDTDNFSGPRAGELRRRFEGSNLRAQALEGAAARMAALCLAQRDLAAAAIEAGSRDTARVGYGPAGPRSLMLDRRG